MTRLASADMHKLMRRWRRINLFALKHCFGCFICLLVRLSPSPFLCCQPSLLLPLHLFLNGAVLNCCLFPSILPTPSAILNNFRVEVLANFVAIACEECVWYDYLRFPQLCEMMKRVSFYGEQSFVSIILVAFVGFTRQTNNKTRRYRIFVFMLLIEKTINSDSFIPISSNKFILSF